MLTFAAFAAATMVTGPAAAEDTLKVAVPMRGNWETAAPDLGARARRSHEYKKVGGAIGCSNLAEVNRLQFLHVLLVLIYLCGDF